MKNKIISATIILGLAGILSCKKQASPDIPLLRTPANIQQAFVKLNYASAYKNNPAVQLKINGVRVSSTINYAYPFPGGGLNTGGGSQADYFATEATSAAFAVTIPKAASTADSTQLFIGTANLTAGNYYSFHIADTGSSARSSLIMENMSQPDSGFTRYRFVNLMPDLPGVDLYFAGTLVAGNIPFMGKSNEFTLVQGTGGKWEIKPAGSGTSLATYPSGTYTVPNQRVMTVFSRGYSTISSSSDARRRQVSLYYTR
ncbi:MAG: DUF4397 domain-containing protein [Terrimonas sp.]|nr:DUF4397 domain-containing protein [Terrimonas sp.]